MARLFFLSLLVTGCVTNEPVMAPDGRRAHYIECPRSMRECLDEAEETCPRGYTVVDEGEKVASAAHGVYRGTMTVVCKRARRASAED